MALMYLSTLFSEDVYGTADGELNADRHSFSSWSTLLTAIPPSVH